MTGILVLVAVSLILTLIPPETFWVAVALAIIIVLYLFVLLLVRGQGVRGKSPPRWHGFFSLGTYFLIMFIVFGILYVFALPSVAAIILIVALMLTLIVNYVTVPLAILHKWKETKKVNSSPEKLPKISIIIPAFNEGKVIARTIENLIEAYYPKGLKEIIVVDDGSKDNTSEIAQRYTKQGIKLVKRENGGKFAALNTGLAYASGEIIISLDADSLVTRPALVEIIKPFNDPDVSGVAGTLKIFNRTNFWTNLQSLEYLTQIEIVRRAFDSFGTITVAPGAFSAFRRQALMEIGNYDPDRLLEDFDITIKLQKAHKVLRGGSDALCYTEAPETLRDLYKQRLSWYRGDFQNFWKHRDVFTNPKFGFMHTLTLPYMVLSMILVSFSSIVVIATTVVMLLNGDWLIVLSAFAIFLLLQILQSALAIQLGRDDWKLLIYSPLFIVGYKHFLDFVMIKALFDIIYNRGTYLKRERVERMGFKDGQWIQGEPHRSLK